MKVVINSCYGGFGLSGEAADQLGLPSIVTFNQERVAANRRDVDRTDPRLVEVVERLGAAANTWASHLVVVAVPDGKHWHIDECDGYEGVIVSDSPIQTVEGDNLCECCNPG